jgi:hypothetical protein
MNALDRKIFELFDEVANRKGWTSAEAFQKYVALRSLIERGINSRSVMIWILKLSIEQNTQKAGN